MAAQGMSIRQISLSLGVDWHTVANWAKRKNVAVKKHIPVSTEPRICECCRKADISDRPINALYCLPCRNSGLVLYAPRKALGLVNTMVKAGLLAKPTEYSCMDCGGPANCYDHRDYLKPMDVDPVCSKCNAARGTALNKFPWHSQITRRAADRKA